jgi:uroporphyrin-III C-methyltransferase
MTKQPPATAPSAPAEAERHDDIAASGTAGNPPWLLPDFRPGEVWLAGAGPGAPELLTLAAWQALQQADVIVHDALVSKAVLSLASPNARLLPVGKRGGDPSSVPQAEITSRLITLAREGKRVLRLKGGDPCLFGRGPEEARALREAGIAFRIIPGIPAGIGGLALAGIPVTTGATNTSVLFLTGHDARGELPDLDWTAVARAGEAIVLYMGLRRARAIAARLLAAGRAPETPVALVSRASLPDQSTIETSLAALVEGRVDPAGVPRPALVVIGEIVRWRPFLEGLSASAGSSSEAQRG